MVNACAVSLRGLTRCFAGGGSTAAQHAQPPTSSPLQGRTRKTVELERAPLPGMPLAPDGLAGVGFSFETTAAGMHILSTLAPAGSAAGSGRMQAGDVLRTVDGVDVQGLSAGEVIKLVKGPPGTKVVLALDSVNPETGQASSPQAQRVVAVSPARSSPTVPPVPQERAPVPSPPQTVLPPWDAHGTQQQHAKTQQEPLPQQSPPPQAPSPEAPRPQAPLQQAPQEALPTPQPPYPDPAPAVQGQPPAMQSQPAHTEPPPQPIQPPPQLPPPAQYQEQQPPMQQQVVPA